MSPSSWVAAGTYVAAGLFAWVVPYSAAGLWPFILVTIFLGLPHGATDVMVFQQLPGSTNVGLGLFLLGYGLLMALVAMLWGCLPAAAFWGFLLLTAWHWGSADRDAEERMNGAAVVRGMGRGLLVMGGALTCGHDESARLMTSLHLTPVGMSPVGPAWLILGTAVELWPRREKRWARVGRLSEALLLLCLFAITPVLWALALYFAVHALRHFHRIAGATGTSRVRFAAVVRAYGKALPYSLGALALGLLMHRDPVGASSRTWLATTFILLSMLTVPHALLVLALDLSTSRQR